MIGRIARSKAPAQCFQREQTTCRRFEVYISLAFAADPSLNLRAGSPDYGPLLQEAFAVEKTKFSSREVLALSHISSAIDPSPAQFEIARWMC